MMNTTTMNNATVNASATAKKLTKKDYFNMLKVVIADSDSENKKALLDFVAHEIELLEKKSSTKKTSAIQEANEGIAKIVLTVLTEVKKPVTVSELLEDSRLATYKVTEKGETKTVRMSGQKLSAIVTNLSKSGQVSRTVEKKKAYFSIPSEK